MEWAYINQLWVSILKLKSAFPRLAFCLPLYNYFN